MATRDLHFKPFLSGYLSQRRIKITATLMKTLRFSALILALTLTASFSIAQDGSESRKDRSSDESGPAREAEGPAERAASRPTVKLLSAGEEPRRQLRYAPPAGGWEQTIVNSRKSTTTQEVMGFNAPPTPNPELRFTLNVSARDVENAENAENLAMTLHIPDVEIVAPPRAAPMAMEPVRQLRAAVMGSKAEFTVSRQGILRDVRVKETAGTDEVASFIRNILQDSIVPLPDDEVGVGASWQVSRIAWFNSVEASETTTYTITKVDDNVIELRATIERTGDAQTITIPGGPPGQELDLRTYTMEGASEMTFSTNDLMIRTGHNTGKEVAEIEVPIRDGTTTLYQTIEVEGTIQPPAPKEASEGDEQSPDESE